MDNALSTSAELDINSLLDGVAVEARDYQIRVASKAVQLMAGLEANMSSNGGSPVRSILIESPTGSGKTVMGLTIARWFQRNLGLSVGWVAMRRNLLGQVAAENTGRGFDVEMELISMFAKLPPAVDLLVVDEAQHDGAMSMATLHSLIRPKRILGLSATPYRTDRVKLCFEQTIRDADIHHLIQEGYLSQYHHFTIPEYTPVSVTEFYTREPDRWGKSLVFFRLLADCLECQRLLQNRGVACEVVTGQSDRERQIHDFVTGRVQVLLSMMVLTEGFDCPALRTVFCRPSGKPCTLQMCGRVFRKHPDCAFKQIVQCRQTRHPFPKTAAPTEQYVWAEQRWNTLKVNAHIAGIGANALRAIAHSKVELPDIVTRSRARAPAPWQRREPDESQ